LLMFGPESWAAGELTSWRRRGDSICQERIKTIPMTDPAAASHQESEKSPLRSIYSPIAILLMFGLESWAAGELTSWRRRGDSICQERIKTIPMTDPAAASHQESEKSPLRSIYSPIAGLPARSCWWRLWCMSQHAIQKGFILFMWGFVWIRFVHLGLSSRLSLGS
jgi:hypothetical protein